ncbi:hypothetical protein Undi14_11770 [Undibacterium sp. 14-3-2]|uniref:hypothetical protein n=1 Tax=Undibacterium sp. 14-3-2 TaxID=2800129 RepID=UPI001902F433|nr:hypothetical protein [Undibacterium sp. 14-3-2]MBK1890711.1 hypothetical protein [Undibacterium sp. 14-3-2]
MDLIHIRLKNELDRLGIKAVAAAKAVGESDSQGLRDVLGGRKRLSADLLAALASIGVDTVFVLTGQHQEAGIGESAVHQAVIDAVDLLSLETKVDAQQLAKAVVKLVAKSAKPATTSAGTKISIGGNFYGHTVEGDFSNTGTMNIGNKNK